jgi:SapC
MATTPKPLYREPVQLNAQLHRHKKLQLLNDFSLLSTSHAVMLNAVEFPLAALAFPIVFVAGSTSDPNIGAAAMMGLVPNDNLFVEGNTWGASYVPAFFRRMPFLTAPLEGTDQMGVYVDIQWPGLSDTEGEPLFTETGEQAPVLAGAIEFMKAYDEEARRTAHLCARLDTLGLLTPMKAEVTLPDNQSLTVDGFMVVDEQKLAELPEAAVMELHRSGALALVHAHLLSLNQMRALMDRHARRVAAQAA